MWLIYKHTSRTSKKSYIGQTKTSIKRRWSQHIHDAKKGSKLHFHNAIRLYGLDDWEHEILEENIPTLSEANIKELYYIKKYNTFEEGYNLTIGGDGSPGVIWTPEKEEERDKDKPKYKFIHFEHGVEELTMHKMCKKYNMSKGTLHSLIKGVKKSYFGWQMYNIVGDNPTNYKESDQKYKFFHEDGIKEFCTIRELSDKYDLVYSKVKYLAEGKSKFVKGWTTKQYKLTYRHNSSTAVIRKWYNKKLDIYEEMSTSELCRTYNLSSGSLTSVAKGRRKHHKGWSLADTVMKQAKADEHKARAELYNEQADNLAVEFVKETTGQKRAEHELDKEFDAAVKIAEKDKNKESSKVQ